jgi:hypothetical protein
MQTLMTRKEVASLETILVSMLSESAHRLEIDTASATFAEAVEVGCLALADGRSLDEAMFFARQVLAPVAA